MLGFHSAGRPVAGFKCEGIGYHMPGFRIFRMMDDGRSLCNPCLLASAGRIFLGLGL